MASWARLANLAESNEFVRQALQVVEAALLRFRLDETCVSFNGGKDCTALLHLLHSVLTRDANNNNNNNSNSNSNVQTSAQIPIFYAQMPDHFEEEAEFVEHMVRRYNLKLLSYPNTRDLKESLRRLKMEAPHIKAIFVGSRRDDLKPGTRLQSMQVTDQDWPEFVRIHPILEWSYAEVWRFIRELEVPYCKLYNQGYSSLGTKSNTVKNSSLLRLTSQGEPYYAPAWELSNGREERLSRSCSLADATCGAAERDRSNGCD